MKFLLSITVFLLAIPVFGQFHTERTSLDTTGFQTFTVVSENIDSFQNWLIREKVQILGSYHPANIVVLQTTEGVFRKKIISNPQVLYSALSSSHPKEELPVPGQNVFVNKINVAHARFPQFNGNGSIVSIREFRFDSLDVDLKNRVITSPLASSEYTIHASIMACLAGGAGNADLAGGGAAPGCHLQSSGFGLLLPEEDYAAVGVTVQNHSYGVEIENYYGPNALAYDVSTLENPHLLHVFSAGNKGSDRSISGVYANVSGFANLTGNFKMAKNVLTVGSVDSLGNVTFFSSRGPAYDGRLKPDLVAFGQDGTSGAAALVSGATAVLQQVFRTKHGTMPRSELLRAVLLNTADDHNNRPGPDFEYGFGNLNLKKAVQGILDGHTIISEVGVGEIAAFPIILPAQTHKFQITLAWNDAPASAGSAKALVHDLDLKLIDPNGQVWLPWVLHTDPNTDSLRLPAIRAVDTLNNVEQITVEVPIPGLYDIQVHGSKVFAANQSFSISYNWDTVGHFEWNYPIRHAPAVAAHDVLLSWETTIQNGLGILEWKPAGLDTWRLLDSAVVMSAGLFRWLLPDTFTEAQVRMRNGIQTYVSDTFLISPELRLKVAFDCPDSVGLYWSPVATEAEYRLFGLGQQQMELLFVTSDTFVVLAKDQFPQLRFAVAAIGPSDHSQGKRSASPDIQQQGIGCYKKGFFAQLNADDQVDITLEVGTIYGLTKVLFEKWDGARFWTILAFDSISNDRFIGTDRQPNQGVNTYRAVLFTSAGGVVLSDTSSVFMNGDKGWLVFPNPVASSGVLQVLTNNFERAEFQLVDALGRLVLNTILEEGSNEVFLPDLPSGCYFFETIENGKRLWSGKLILQN